MNDPHEHLRNRLAAVIDDAVGEGLWDPRDVADTVITALDLRVDRVGTLTRWVSQWENPQ